MEFPSGWTCERTTRQFDLYLEATITLSDSLSIAEHLEACVECAQRLVLFRATLVRHPRA